MRTNFEEQPHKECEINPSNPNLARPTKQRSKVSMLKATGKSTNGTVKHDRVILLVVRLDRRNRM